MKEKNPFKNERLIVAAIVNCSCLAGLSEESRMESLVLQPSPDAGETLPLTHICCVLPILLVQQGLGWEEWIGWGVMADVNLKLA